MDLNQLYNSPKDDYLLTNGNWQKADFYTLETSSSFWNKAIITTLPKIFAKTNIEALIYLLQKKPKHYKYGKVSGVGLHQQYLIL